MYCIIFWLDYIILISMCLHEWSFYRRRIFYFYAIQVLLSRLLWTISKDNDTIYYLFDFPCCFQQMLWPLIFFVFALIKTINNHVIFCPFCYLLLYNAFVIWWIILVLFETFIVFLGSYLIHFIARTNFLCHLMMHTFPNL